MKKNWNGFAKKLIQERLEFVKSQALASIEAQESLEQNENLSLAVADQLSENVVGTGNSLNNNIEGNGGDNHLYGLAGDDGVADFVGGNRRQINLFFRILLAEQSRTAYRFYRQQQHHKQIKSSILLEKLILA